MRDPNTGRMIFAFFETRLASKAARFRLAVSIGFIITTVGFFLVGPDAKPSMADDSLWGAMSTLFGGSAPVDQAASVRPSDPRRYRLRAHLRQRRTAVKHSPAVDVVQQTGNTMCVRLCDGYAFPVGPYHGKGDNVAHQAICRSSCPDAKTSLYVVPAGSDEIGKGIELMTGRNYSELPDAFHYTTVLNDACTCHKDGVDGKALSLLRDFTLRRGDAVMTARGIRVFHGSQHYPYRRDDFVGLTRSRDVRNANRTAMKAIERASLAAAQSTPKSAALSERSIPSGGPGVPEFATTTPPGIPVGQPAAQTKENAS
jgi:hypothetical protein